VRHAVVPASADVRRRRARGVPDGRRGFVPV